MLIAMREILNPNVVMGIDTENNKLLLKEEGNDSKLSKLYITNIPEDALAFTLDHQTNTFMGQTHHLKLSLFCSSSTSFNIIELNQKCIFSIDWL